MLSHKLLNKFISIFLGFNLALFPGQSSKKAGQDCLAPKSSFQQEAYFPTITLPAETTPSFLDNLISDLKVAVDELTLTFNPIRFIALHDNRTETGKIDWKKLSSRIIGVSLIYASMIFGPYLLGKLLIASNPLVLLPVIIIAIFISNIAAHISYDKLARSFQLAVLSINLPELGKEGRMALSVSGLTPHFGPGKAEELAKRIKEELGDPENSAEKRKVLGKGKDQFNVFVGKRRNMTKWGIMEEDLPKLAFYYGANMREGDLPTLDEEGGISLGSPRLTPYFGSGKAHQIAKQLKKVLGRAERSKEIRKILGKGKDQFEVFLGKSGPCTTWGIMEGDLFKLAKYFGAVIQEGQFSKLGEEKRVSLSAQGLGPYFGDKKAGNIVKELEEELGNAEFSAEKKKVLGERENQFTIFVGKNGRHTKWGIMEEDIPKLAEYCRVEIRKNALPKLGEEGRISLSAKSLDLYFGWGQAEKIRKRLKKELIDIAKNTDPRKTLGKGKDQFEIFLGKSGPNIGWGILEEDLPRLAKLYGCVIREGELPKLGEEGRISLGGPGLAPYFGPGKANEIASQLTKELGDPEKSTEPRKTLGKGKDKFEVFIGKSGPRTTWGIMEENLTQLSKYIGEFYKEELPTLGMNGRIVLSSRGLLAYFGSGKAEELAKRIKEKLGGPAASAEKRKTLGEGKNRIEVFLGKSGTLTEWGIMEEDIEKLAKTFKVKIIRDGQEEIDRLNLSEVIALLGRDPLRLQQYLRIYHPDMSPEDMNLIVTTSLRGLRAEYPEEDEDYEEYNETLPPIEIDQYEEGSVPETELHSVQISGRAEPGTPFIQVEGAYTRKIKVKNDGTFSAALPLPKTGEINEFILYAVNFETEERSPARVIQVQQTSVPEDAEEAFLRLVGLREEVLESIQRNPTRYNFLLRSVELSLLRHFTQDEKAGFKYLKHLIRKEKVKAKKKMLIAIQEKFKTIANVDLKIKPNQRIYFFQKYVIYESRMLLEDGEAHGILIANEQGTGKTVIALLIANGHETVILTPNPVVSTWSEQEEKFIPEVNLSALEGSYVERDALLEELETPQVVTNIEFVRGLTEARVGLLSRPEGVLVVDEADYLGSTTSQQSKGTEQINARFKILLTATPFKKISQIGRILSFLRPGDTRFQSARAFAQAFPADDPQALNALFLLLQQHMIRIRKKDVFQEYDPKIPLAQQKDKLPRKVEIQPENTETGQFLLSQEQCHSILQLFTDYQRWCQTHRGHESEEDTQFHRYKEGYFSKKEALRQIMNDPAYIERDDVDSPKHQAMDRIVGRELDGRANKGKKLLIFTRYRAQVEKYLQRYASYGARAYYGGLAQNRDGYKIDDQKRVLYYKVDAYGNFVLDENKQFVPATKETGKPIRALDYEKILFQNDPESRILIATYDTGSVGVTFTAADVVVYDDLAPTYRDQYQAGDRAHRIDNDRKKYEVTYYGLQALYPEEFLQQLPQDVREKYFDPGTFDQIHFQNLGRQGRIFHRIMDGIGSEEELVELNQRFMRERMPFMFANGEVGEEEQEHSFIAQGEEALKEFYDRRKQIEQPENEVTEKFKPGVSSLLGIVQKLMNHSNSFVDQLRQIQNRVSQPDFKVYAFDAIVKGEDDYVLAHYDRARNILYIATDVYEKLRNRVPPSLKTLADEFILHELLCPTFSHYLSIFLQQQIFRSHYPDTIALESQEFMEPYKGLLGEALREFIQEKMGKKNGHLIRFDRPYVPVNDRLRKAFDYDAVFELCA